MQSKAATVEEYLAELPDDRRSAISKVRSVMKKNMPKGIQERMAYGMIGYSVPHSIYPAGYHCDPKQPLPFAGLASQKGHMSLYLSCVYQGSTSEEWLREQFAARGKKLDMGKACIRFKKLEDLPLDVIAEALQQQKVDEFIATYEKVLNRPKATKKK